MSRIRALIFAKYPRPGTVKTRLCPPLTPEQAAKVQAAFVRHVTNNVLACETADTVLVVSPDDAGPDFRTLVGRRVEIWPQGDGDLGQRLERASERAFAEGSSSVVFIGTDSPTISWTLIDELPTQLEHADAVIGPCEDGGYYFLATRGHYPELLRDIPWGTDRVLEQTRANARRSGLSMLEAPLGYDVDRIEDLRRAYRELAASGGANDLTSVLKTILAQVK